MGRRNNKQPSNKQTLTAQINKKGSTTAKPNASKAVGQTSEKKDENSAKLMAQQRADFALKAVQAAIANPSIESKEFKSQVRRLPGMLQVNGFGQAMAFYYAKGKSGNLPACGEVYALLERWLCEESPHSPYRGVDASEPRLLTAITSADQQAYRQAQAETQALLQWVKRFCEGLIVKETGETSEEA